MTRLTSVEEWRPADITDMEPAAWQIVRSTSNRSVVAGPGAGKTELLAQRACFLLQTGGCRWPKRILAISFKRDSAANLRERVRKRCGTELSSRFDSFTFDRFSKEMLDRFLPGIPLEWRPKNYLIEDAKKEEIDLFLDALIDQNSKSHEYKYTDRPTIHRFKMTYINGLELPLVSFVPQNLWQFGALLWWQRWLKGSNGRSKLSFPMIERLAALILKANPSIRNALQATYSHLFLDEFQDTTAPQYSLVIAAFQNSNTIITAVGDDKQRIMGWAGALPDGFRRFEGDFEADRLDLISNYRSTTELVSIQHVLAKRIDPNYTETTSKVESAFSGDHCIIYEYETPEMESLHLAELIMGSIESRNLSPRDVALIVRQRPEDYVPQLTSVFGGHGLKLRNEREIQDLLAERFTQLLLPFLRIASSGNSNKFWNKCLEDVIYVHGIEVENASNRITNELDEFLSVLSQEFKAWPSSVEQIRSIINEISQFLGEDNIKLVFPEYEQGDSFQRVNDSLVYYLTKCCDRSGNWVNALDDLEGVNSVPLLTIHKSKGLEYDTVIFLGLDDSSWWSFSQQPEDSIREFFVAFSRAKQKVVFTYCEARGGQKKVASLYDLLNESGVQALKIS